MIKGYFPLTFMWIRLGLVGLAPAMHAADKDNWTRHFRLGTQIGMNIDAEFSMSGGFRISGSQPGPTGVGGADHIYDDGYVRVDETVNAGGLTSNWGYQSRTQHDAVDQTLTFHSAQSFSTTGQSVVEDSPFVGFDMAYGVNLTRWKGAHIGIDLGYGLLPIEIEDTRPLSANIRRTVHQFDTGGIVLPSAPYNGGPDGVGPTISDTATGLPDQTVNGMIRGSRTLDATLHSVRLGPTVHWQFAPRWALSAGAGFALGIVTSEYKFDERIQVIGSGQTTNRGTLSQTDVEYGGYVNGMLHFRATEGADVYLGAQFMGMTDTEVSGEGRRAQLNLGQGVYFTAGINWPF